MTNYLRLNIETVFGIIIGLAWAYSFPDLSWCQYLFIGGVSMMFAQIYSEVVFKW